MHKSIDVVITWVDGNHPHHQAIRKETAERFGLERPESAAPTRFNQCGELVYCITSIFRFMPWIRTIHIVVDEPNHPLLQTIVHQFTPEKINLVSHQVLFAGYETYLPTFNSLAIETLLWRVPGLSEQFIYFNDDCFILRPLTPAHFFHDHQMIVRGEWKLQAAYDYLKKWINLVLGKKKPIEFHRLVQQNSAKLAGFQRKYLHLAHVPFPLSCQQFRDFFAQHPQLLQENLRPRFREKTQFWPISLAYHLQLNKQDALVDETHSAMMINAAHHSFEKIKKRLQQIDKDNQIIFLCLQSLDSAPADVQDYLLSWLKTHIGHACDTKSSLI